MLVSSQVKMMVRDNIKGKTTILVDDSFQPLIEDQVAVFESKYKADITVQGKSKRINTILS
jgi:phosphate transport system substrate-binding protein